MRALLLAVVAVFGLVTVGGAQPRVVAQVNEIEWERCGSFDCGTLLVPLDYDDPAGEQIELALIRNKADDEDRRIGSLLVNPGGPGGSGVEFARAWSLVLSGEIRDRFDIVGWDPRGVGDSSPLECHETLQEYVAADPSPDSQAEWDTLDRVTEEFADDCAEAAGDRIDHYGTKNVARDLDRIREALGDTKLNYVGYSYGTIIGQTYLDMFPENARAIVLDGAVDLSIDIGELTLEQAAGFERALANFVENCRDRGDRCSINEYGDPMDVVREVMRRAEESPIPSKDGDRPAGPGEAVLGIIAPLYADALWSSLDRALDEAMQGDGSGLVDLTDRYLGRRGNDYSNQTETNLAVNCIDAAPSSLPLTYDDYQQLGAELERVSPLFGRAFANGLACFHWNANADPLSPLHGIDLDTSALVVSTTGDPATPYEWGVKVAAQIGDAVLLTYRGEGHTAYVGGDDCIDDAVDAYLVSLELPEVGTVCGDGPDIPDGLSPGTEAPSGGSTLDGDGVGMAWRVLEYGVLAVFVVMVVAGALVMRRR